MKATQRGTKGLGFLEIIALKLNLNFEFVYRSKLESAQH